MRLSRTLTFSIAVIAALGSAIAVRKAIVTKHQPPVITSTPTVELLVASRALSAGERIDASDLRWRTWPKEAAPKTAILRESGGSLSNFDRSLARYPIMEGEPVSAVKLVRPGEGGHAAALLATGKRAIAVPVREESAAGGLVQPNDRVDVLWSGNAENGAQRQPVARTLLRGIRVLAVDGSVSADAAHTGNHTATLELTPEQVRILAGARVNGEISLSLIPLNDEIAAVAPPDGQIAAAAPEPVKILKFGRGQAEYLGRSLQ